jgi:hypothetical protein
VPAPTAAALKAVPHKIITRMLKLRTLRGALVAEQGSAYIADNDADSDDARTLRPLQAAACPYRIAFGSRRAAQKLRHDRQLATRCGCRRGRIRAAGDGALVIHRRRCVWRRADRLEQAFSVARAQPDTLELGIVEIAQDVQVDSRLPQQRFQASQALFVQPRGQIHRAHLLIGC